MNGVLRHLRRAALLDSSSGLTDGQLLDCFLARREEAAFEALLRRHGPMVWGVCRRVLNQREDVEDAFQATFLVLVRKANSIRPRDLVGPWLYGVAFRTALKARAMTSRRRSKEGQAARRPEEETPAGQPWDDLLPHLDHELNRLPEKYRVPVVLCELEGKSRKEAARVLKIAEGTLSSRLAYARKLLARRLARHGGALSAGALAALAPNGAPACPPAPLLASTARVALGRAETPSGVMALAERVVRSMLMARLKIVALVLLFGSAVALGVGNLPFLARATGEETALPPKPTPKAPAAPKKKGDGIAWGKSVNGLRIGLAFDAKRNTFRTWERVAFRVVLANVSDHTIRFTYYKPTFLGGPYPTVFDGAGNQVPLTQPPLSIAVMPVHARLGPGKTLDLGGPSIFFGQPKGQEQFVGATLLAKPGRYSLWLEFRLERTQPGDWAGTLKTGRLKLQVTEPPPKPRPQRQPASRPEGKASDD